MLTLILGGARSGKSDLAERLAAASGRPVIVVAPMEPGDDEMRARIAAHRASRPPGWRTVEEPIALLDALAQSQPGDFIIIDCITLWVSNLLLSGIGDADTATTDEIHAAVAAALPLAAQLAAWCEAFDGEVAVVSNEVGAGIVPAYPLGRVFRDAIGTANRALAARADRVYYAIAGLALEIKSLGAVPIEPSGGAGE
jgi:adenosylcobinamide kinase/adenosylcobinamide-phosphate guanylyltransferase